jgi:ribosomal protein S7
MSKTKKYFVENKKVILFNKKDPVFFSWFLLKFINKFMKGGQKNKVLKIMFQALSVFKKRYNINPIIVYFLVIQKIKPIVDIKVLGFGNKKFTVPVSLSLAKQYKKAVKLLF